MIYPLLRRLLFRLDAEAAHELAVEQMERVQEIPLLLRAIERFCKPPAGAARTLFGLRFPSPIGIAAGFDKNALLMPMLAALGFGFIEAGTVTLHPQPGNPRPRLFRDSQNRALINRMGFNNDGAEAVAARLRAWKRSVPLFINVGKNRDVPLEGAVDAYVECYRRVAPHADAAVLNLSSPNTPGLRELQRPEHLEALLHGVQSVRSGPVLIKIAPDLDDAQLAEICDVCVKLADGMVCTNTTVDRPDLSLERRAPSPAESSRRKPAGEGARRSTVLHEAGGLSGKPLFAKSTRVLAKVRACVGRDYPLIGVGGVFTADDVREKMAAGADLVQVYTGFIYEGPFIARRLARA
ncbi:MAG TPA: quinone-dependent dihydroorotate dehydrogenase [Thermoanaerobaculia bacterium]|nr:quinone-dependent dihydroorotate dehydrogenase [Thermoanaerobaculia bacterium]